MRALFDKMKTYPEEGIAGGRVLTASETVLWNKLEDGALADLLRVAEVMARANVSRDGEHCAWCGVAAAWPLRRFPHADSCGVAIAGRLMGMKP